ncbi:MAG: YihY/virulence factor BrkB family protein [Deltaproteobacteria bacterium]|nr:YihY/virulence factor BrkB family protein [Deltaproteobacteria bacterium]
MKGIADRAKALKDLLQEGIWKVRLTDLKGFHRLLFSILRILSVTIRKFMADQCSLRSSALTFYTLMSIVPVAAVAFAIAKGFGFQKLLEQRLMENFAGHEDVVAQIIEFSRRLLENTQGGLLAGVGIIVLLWSAIKVLDNIELSFNHIWAVEQSRSFGRKFSDYLSIMLIAPILLITSSSATVMVVTQISHITGLLGLGLLNPLIALLMRLIPYCLIWFLFAFVYVFIPNTKVTLASGLIAGFTAGSIFEVVQGIYIHFQVGVAQYNAIYGSFAALPLFLVWLQLSWLIVLFGAELSYAHQNAKSGDSQIDPCRISPSRGKMLSLLITRIIVVNFVKGEPALSAVRVSDALELPLALVKATLADLCEAGVLSETWSDNHAVPAYQPARDTGTLSVASVLTALEDKGLHLYPLPETEEIANLGNILEELRLCLESSPANVLLRDI